jgi:hypothetical protein
VQARAINIDNVDGSFPIGHHRIILQSAEEDKHIAGFRPGWFEILMAARERFALGLAIRVDVDFAVFEIGSPVASAR